MHVDILKQAREIDTSAATVATGVMECFHHRDTENTERTDEKYGTAI